MVSRIVTPPPTSPERGSIQVVTTMGEHHTYPSGTQFTTDKMIPMGEDVPQSFERTGELYIVKDGVRLAVYGSGQWGSVRVL